MVEAPSDYQWSSYQANAQQVEDGVVQNHPIYTQLGVSDAERCKAYRELFRSHIDSDLIHQIREALHHELVLRSSYFKNRIKDITNRQARLGKPGRPPIEEQDVGYVVFG